MTGYPHLLVPPDGTAPVPRRLRGLLGDRWVFDTRRAVYGWETPAYPQYHVPFADLAPGLLVDEARTADGPFGPVAVWGLRLGDQHRPGTVQVLGDVAPGPLRGTARVAWEALDAWFEEDEQVHVHPRNPYSRVDALPAEVPVRVELDGVVLAEASSAVRLFETGLPPRTYLPRTALRMEHLEPSPTVTSCPYKGTTSRYWSVRVGGVLHSDLAWEYAFPVASLAAIAGRVAFYDEHVDTYLGGERQTRPATPFR